MGRTVKLAPSVELLRSQIPYAVAEATGTPFPPPPSHALSYSLVGAGGLVVLAGGFVGLQAFAHETAVLKELELGEAQRVVLKPSAYYQESRDAISRDKTIALVGVLLGAAAIGCGVYLDPKVPSQTGARAALVPSGTGFALVGSWE